MCKSAGSYGFFCLCPAELAQLDISMITFQVRRGWMKQVFPKLRALAQVADNIKGGKERKQEILPSICP